MPLEQCAFKTCSWSMLDLKYYSRLLKSRTKGENGESSFSLQATVLHIAPVGVATAYSYSYSQFALHETQTASKK